MIVSPASEAELNQWAAEAIQSRNEQLLKSDVPSLEKIANEEYANRQPQAEVQANLDIAAQQRRDSTRGFKPLPLEIDRAAIKKASGEQFRKWTKIYGLTQLTERARQTA